jgi:hypothetical protein
MSAWLLCTHNAWEVLTLNDAGLRAGSLCI